MRYLALLLLVACEGTRITEVPPEPLRARITWPEAVVAIEEAVWVPVDVCDGVDNDEDGEIDEDYAPRFCEPVDDCPVVEVCTLGATQCLRVDCEPSLCTEAVDIAVVFDRTVSMQDWSATIASELASQAQRCPGCAWYLIDVPAANAYDPPHKPNEICHGSEYPLDACPLDTFATALSDISRNWYGGVERTHDVLTEIEDLINWREGAERKVWVFADEKAQGTTSASTAAQNTRNLDVTVWTSPETRDTYVWDTRAISAPVDSPCD